MRTKIITGALLLASCVVLVFTVFAKSTHPYRNGSVWSVSFIRMEPGMESAYLEYVATDWKKVMDAMKSEGLILSYKVLTTEGHDGEDWNIMLMSEYKDMATMEANENKEEAVAMKAVGDDAKMREGYKQRMNMRSIIGSRMAREIILESK